MKTCGTVVRLLFVLLFGLLTQAEAEWSGASTTCPSDNGGLGATCPTYSAACDSWAAFYKSEPEVLQIIPFSTGYTCKVKHWFGTAIASVPTFPACGPGEEVNVNLASGCQPHDGSECPNCENGNPSEGNPIAVSNGNKFDQVTDFETSGPDALRFIRYYNSYEKQEHPLGLGWRSNFDRGLEFLSSTITLAFRADGREVVFTLIGGVWTPNTDVRLTLTTDATTWTLTDQNDTTEVYDNLGQLQTIQTRNGYQQILQYDANNQLTTITDTHGRELTLTYDGPRLTTMTDPDSHVYTYIYEKTNPYFADPNLLTSVTYPDETAGDPTDNPVVTYLYEHENFLYGLTGIIDENGDRYATYAYDDEGRATLSEHANGAEQVTIVYDSDTQRTVTDALGRITVYQFTWVQGVRKILQEDRLATATVPAATKTWTYDGNGYIASRTDWKGNLTTFVNNAQGLQTSRTEASGTPDARTITTTWHATLRLPTQIVGPGRTTDFTYDATGKLLTRTETDTTGGPTNGQTRTWTYTYTVTGLLETVNGPRTDVTDTTTNTYTSEGYLEQVTNALGHVTEITSHNARGLPLTMKDANNVETQLSYHPRGWLASATTISAQGNASTLFEYDHIGQVTRITRPDGSTLLYDYDAAHRVTGISTNTGERIDYTLDAEGNRTAETVKSATGTIVRTQTRTFDSLSRLLTQVGASSQTTTYAYDANGNTVSITDPLTNPTQQAFDALNRLVKVTDPLSGEADYTYTGQDHLASVADQRNLTTTYTYNGFGDVIQLTSPDTGTTTYVVDAAGNRTQQTDARSIVTNYTYDALNRVATMQFPASTQENVTYAYDDQTAGNKGKGRLTSITDQSGTTSYVYDERGNVLTDTRVMGGQTYATQYQYDLADHLIQVTYPSGRLVNYQRDAQGRVATVTTQLTASQAPTPLATNITYEPFGPITTLTYGNGLVLDLSYDQDYRLTAIHTANGGTVIQNLSYTHDAADNITAITDSLTPARNQTFGYNALHNLTSATGLYGTLGYTYDAVGNRLTRTLGGTTETLTYAAGSNRLLSVADGSTTRTLTHTPNGQTTTDNRGVGEVYDLLYNHQNRLNEVRKNSVADTRYTYNALGQRVLKDTVAPATVDIHFLYDQDGQLLTESTTAGTITREYIQLEGLPLAIVDVGGSGSGPSLDLILDNTDATVTATGSWTSTTTPSGHEGTDYLTHVALGSSANEVLVDNSESAFQSTGGWVPDFGGTGYQGGNYLTRLATSPPPASTVTVDNQDPTFQATPLWSTLSAGSGYEGINYLVHAGTAFTGQAQILDNDDPTFSLVGDWTASTNLPGYEGSNYLWGEPQSLQSDGEVIDNTDPGFSVSGTWPTATGTAGYEGSNYAYHNPNGLPPSATIIDNTDPTTTTVGVWKTSKTVWGYEGTNYQYFTAGTGANTFTWPLPVTTTELHDVYAKWTGGSSRADNAKYTVHHAGGSTTVIVNQEVNGGTWQLLGSFSLEPAQNHRVVLSDDGNGYLIADAVAVVPASAPANTATWLPTITTAGDYALFVSWTSRSTRATNAAYTIYHADGQTTVHMNQKINGLEWNALGTYHFEPNEDHRIELTDRADGIVIADAIRVVQTANPPTATWTPTLSSATEYDVYAKWVAWTARATDAPYTIHHDGGESIVRVNQKVGNGVWHWLGRYPLTPSQNHRLSLSNDANGQVCADAIAVDAGRNEATWTLPITTATTYEVFAKWMSDGTRATDAPYTITHVGGQTTVTVDQQQNGGTWQSLGTYQLASGQATVLLTDRANGTVSADAIQAVPVPGAPSVATWIPEVPSAGDYDIYARWSAHSSPPVSYATDAPYTIYHASGSTTVNQNQQVGGGQWNLLGTFSLTPSQNHRIELSDQANGTVMADAVYLVPSGTPPNTVTWTPTLTVTESVDVYAKWTSQADRADMAIYTVHHAGGSTPVEVNQKQNGGTWNWLGQFSMAPASNHSVELTDSSSGVVVADAVRFVSAGGASATGLSYVHTDHLGTPQKMTDGNKTVVWDAVYKPFGETHSITGTASNNKRFPGQYADAESGFSYNFYRDYDPTVGRYVESDPIGLIGGANTYAYVGGNPSKWSDPLGLFFPDHHGFMTRGAAGAAGCDNLADKLGDATAAVDSAQGSQSAENAFWHAMSDGTIANPEVAKAQALADFLQYITTNFESGNIEDLAKALHAMQDAYSPAHEGFQPWNGPWPATPLLDLAQHGLQDFFGAYSSNFDIAQAVSEGMLKNWKSRFPCECSKQPDTGDTEW